MKLHTLLIFLLFSAKQYFVVGDTHTDNTDLYTGDTHTDNTDPNTGDTHTDNTDPYTGDTHTDNTDPNTGDTHTDNTDPYTGDTHTDNTDPNTHTDDPNTHTDDPNQPPVPIHYLSTSDSNGWKVQYYSSANPTIRICLGLEIQITKEQTTGHPLKIVEGYQNWQNAKDATAIYNGNMGTSEVSTAITLTPTSNITYTYICTAHPAMIGYIEVNSEYCQDNHDHNQSHCLSINDFQACNDDTECTYVLHKFDEPQTCECVSINDSCFEETESEEGPDCVSQTSLPTNCTSNNDQHNHINDDINNGPPPVSCNTYSGCTGDYRLKLEATCLSGSCDDATCCEDRMRCNRFQYNGGNNNGCENNNKVWNSVKADVFCDASGCTANKCCDAPATPAPATTCAEFDCPSNTPTAKFFKNDGATCNGNCDQATCCGQYASCASFSCDHQSLLKSTEFCTGKETSSCNVATCCDTSATCADWSGTCPGSKIAKVDSTVCGGNADICSETICCRMPFNCGTITHDETITRYEASTVPYGQLCASETRTCDDGALSGSYTFESCTVESAPAQTVTDITFNNVVKTYTICSGESASVTWGGNHNICELSDQTAFNSPPSSNQNCVSGTERHAFEDTGTVETLSNLGAAPGQTRYFICSEHPDAKFKVACPVPSFDILLQYLRDAFNTFNDCSASSDFPHQIYVKASGDSVFVSYTNSSGHVFSAQKYTDNNVETLDKNIGTGAPTDAKYKLDSDYYKEDFEKL